MRNRTAGMSGSYCELGLDLNPRVELTQVRFEAPASFVPLMPRRYPWTSNIQNHLTHDKDLSEVDGIPCTTALRTIIDISPDYPAENVARMVADALRRNLVTGAEALARTAEPGPVGGGGAVGGRGEVLCGEARRVGKRWRSRWGRGG